MNYLVCGNYGATNLGDEAILAGTIIELKDQSPDCKITALSYNPTQTKTDHKIDATYFLPFGVRSLIRGIFKLELIKTLKAIKNCDVFILGGGGLFSNESWKANAIWSLHAQTARFFSKPIHIHAQTFDPLSSKFWHRSAISIFRKAKKVTVRDQQSLENLKKEGIAKAILVKDPAWNLEAEIHKTPIANPKKQIVISLRHWRSKEGSVVKWLKQQLTTTLKDFHFVLIPFQTLNSNDIEVLSQLSHELKKANISHELIKKINFKQALNEINQSRGVIAMRLHACIFSAICQKPFFSIAYLPKVSNFQSQHDRISQNTTIKEIRTQKIELTKKIKNFEELARE